MKAASRGTPGGSWSAARVGKDCNRGDRENCREGDATVAINFLGAFRLLIVIEDRRHQNFDQGKENQQCADEEKKVDSRHVRQPRHLCVHGIAISDQRQHLCDGDADLRVGGDRIDPENGPRHHYDQDEWKNHF